LESCAETLVAAARNAAVKSAAVSDVNRFILSSCFASNFHGRAALGGRATRLR
jgi:hypothetical protein